MQILGKRSKILLIAVAIVMLVAIGVSFAMWDLNAVKATSGNSSTYANAKVGDIIEFGQYYQTGNKVNNIEYEKTPIRWIVVDKDERTGQLTLISEKILAAGSYFGNYYYNTSSEKGTWGSHYDSDSTVAKFSYNQAYVDSTVRAYLNNLERLDMGGDIFDATKGYVPSGIDSTKDGYDTTTPSKFVKGTGLLSSVGFSNQRYYTYLGKSTAAASKPGFYPSPDNDELYYQRPIRVSGQIEPTIYQERPATIGFCDEAFTNEEKSMIVPKQIAGYTGFRWPDNTHDVRLKSYVEGAVDKVWIPSATELNIMEGKDWYGNPNDAWTNPSDEAGSTVFEYFKNYSKYINPVYGTQNNSVADAVKTKRTTFAENSYAMNYSIPVYNKGTTEELGSTDETKDKKINATTNSTNHYWTRSPSSYWFGRVRTVGDSGLFTQYGTSNSNLGVRPCVILKY